MPKTKNSGFPTDLSSLPKFGAGGRPPRNRSRAPVFRTGPRILQLGKKPRKAETQVWTVPPPGFLTAHNSVDEWMVYLALAMHLDDPPNPFKPPFVGGATKWVYQKAESPTGLGLGIGRVPAGSVTDFAVAEGGGWLVLRLQTERFPRIRRAADSGEGHRHPRQPARGHGCHRHLFAGLHLRHDRAGGDESDRAGAQTHRIPVPDRRSYRTSGQATEMRGPP